MNAEQSGVPSQGRDLLSTSELARAIGVDESVVHYAARRHIAEPVQMIANRRLWSPDSIAVIRAFVAARTSRRAAQPTARAQTRRSAQ
jgi:hypothetical protein